MEDVGGGVLDRKFVAWWELAWQAEILRPTRTTVGHANEQPIYCNYSIALTVCGRSRSRSKSRRQKKEHPASNTCTGRQMPCLYLSACMLASYFAASDDFARKDRHRPLGAKRGNRL